MGGLEGVSPTRVIASLHDNLGKAWKGDPANPVLIDTAEHIRDLFDIPVPAAVNANSAGYLTEINAVREYVNKGTTASGKLGSLKMAAGEGALGAVAGAMAGGGLDMGLGAVAGAAMGAAAPHISKKLLVDLSGGIETVMRQEAWSQEFLRAVDESRAYLSKIVDDALSGTKIQIEMPGVPGPTSGPRIEGSWEILHEGGMRKVRKLEDVTDASYTMRDAVKDNPGNLYMVGAKGQKLPIKRVGNQNLYPGDFYPPNPRDIGGGPAGITRIEDEAGQTIWPKTTQQPNPKAPWTATQYDPDLSRSAQPAAFRQPWPQHERPRGDLLGYRRARRGRLAPNPRKHPPRGRSTGDDCSERGPAVAHDPDRCLQTGRRFRGQNPFRLREPQ
jgi:hypothetical protein